LEKLFQFFKGDEYRLIVAIDYHYKILLIKWIGTHKEYDQIDASEVEYDQGRYYDSSH
jgi:mRNA interferase HigB